MVVIFFFFKRGEGPSQSAATAALKAIPGRCEVCAARNYL